MLDVLSIVTPIYLLIGLGYLAIRRTIVSREDIRGMGAFVIRFALPALIFKSLSQRSFADIFNAQSFCVYAGGSLLAFGVMYFPARLLGKSQAQAAIQALGASASNSGYIGYSLALLVVGPPAALVLALTLFVENMLILPLALTLAESDSQTQRSAGAMFVHLVLRLAKNPLILAIIAGAIVSVSGFKLPAPLLKTIDILSLSASSVALFAIGGGLAGLRLEGLARDASAIASYKLLLHPLAVFLLLQLAPSLDPTTKKALLIFAGAPMFSIYPLMSSPFGLEKLGAAALMIATIFSFFSLSGLLLVL